MQPQDAMRRDVARAARYSTGWLAGFVPWKPGASLLDCAERPVLVVLHAWSWVQREPFEPVKQVGEPVKCVGVWVGDVRRQLSQLNQANQTNHDQTGPYWIWTCTWKGEKAEGVPWPMSGCLEQPRTLVGSDVSKWTMTGDLAY